MYASQLIFFELVLKSLKGEYIIIARLNKGTNLKHLPINLCINLRLEIK